MELRQLRYFVAVAETGNISRAAKKIFLTQPALSRQIKALEDEVGEPLLERLANSSRLTLAGETLLREAHDLFRRVDEALERVRACGKSLRLRVGYAPSLANGVLTAAVEQFAHRHPSARVELLDFSTQEMLDGLGDKILDVAITVAPDRPVRGFQWIPLVNVPWLVGRRELPCRVHRGIAHRGPGLPRRRANLGSTA